MPACLLLALRATSPGRGSLSKGGPRPWRERFLPLFRKGTKGILGVLLASPVGRGGCDQREQTERAHPLPCGELPPQRLRGLQIGEARKMLLAKRLAFFRFDFSFGIIKGEQPLIRGSSASKSLVVFWFSFAIKREQSPPGETLSQNISHFFIVYTKTPQTSVTGSQKFVFCRRLPLFTLKRVCYTGFVP